MSFIIESHNKANDQLDSGYTGYQTRWAQLFADALKMSVHEVDSDNYILYKGTYNGTGLKLYRGNVGTYANQLSIAYADSETTQVPEQNATGARTSVMPRILYSASNPFYVYYPSTNSVNGDTGLVFLSNSTNFGYEIFCYAWWTKEQHSDGSVGYLYGTGRYQQEHFILGNDSGDVFELRANSGMSYWYDSDTITDVYMAPITVGDITSSRVFLPVKFIGTSAQLYLEDEDGYEYFSTPGYSATYAKIIIKIT